MYSQSKLKNENIMGIIHTCKYYFLPNLIFINNNQLKYIFLLLLHKMKLSFLVLLVSATS